jgi:hypothetical protein
MKHSPWLTGYIAVQNLPPVVADDEETVQNPERQRRHREEVHRGDCFTMISEKYEPALGWIPITSRTLHPTRHRAL